MNILFVCDEYPPGRNGGIGSMVRNLAVEFVRQGHQVFVVGLYPHGYGGDDFFIDEGVKVWRKKYVTDIGLISNTFSLKDKILLKLLRVTGILKMDAKWSAQKLFSFIGQLIKQYKIDIIEIPDHNQFFFQGKGYRSSEV
jgi:glycogen(starch) synthase